MKNLAMIVVSAAMAGCAAYQPIPAGYGGPIATVSDSGAYVDDWKKGEVFALTEIDGKPIMDSFLASNKQSLGQGFNLNLDIRSRAIPATPARVKLRGSHVTGAPIHAIASTLVGTYFTVEGIVSFDPKPDQRYVVKGELKKSGSSVWIEEESSGQIVTEKVVEQSGQR